MNIYLAGYIQGTKIKQCSEWRKKIREHVEAHYYPEITILDPLNGKDFASLTADGLKSNRPPHAIVHRDRMSIESADLIIANMNRFGEQRVSVGTICELAWGFQLEKPIIMITNEKQYSEHPFLSYFASAIYKTVDELIENEIIDYFYKGVIHAIY